MEGSIDTAARLISPRETFRAHMPTATIETSSLQLFPKAAITLFDNRARMHISEDLFRPGTYKNPLHIHHDSGGDTYVARQTVAKVDGSETDWTYFFDVDDHGAEQGYGEMIRTATGMPMVGFTFTNPETPGVIGGNQRKKGLGERRLHMMNAAAKMQYDQPLHSGFMIEDSARRIWERLVTEGKAVSFMDDEHQRYRFV